jgi:hypothetical protein
MFLPTLERFFYIFHIHMKPLKIQQLPYYNFLCSFNVVVNQLENIYLIHNPNQHFVIHN